MMNFAVMLMATSHLVSFFIK